MFKLAIKGVSVIAATPNKKVPNAAVSLEFIPKTILIIFFEVILTQTILSRDGFGIRGLKQIQFLENKFHRQPQMSEV